VKKALQFSPALVIATLLAILWFAIWLSLFEPIGVTRAEPSIAPTTTYLPVIDEPFRTLRSPMLFALPSQYGFSGTFPARYATAEISLEAPQQKEFVLAREAVRTPPPSTRTLDPVPLLEEALTRPAIGPKPPTLPQPEQTAFYFSKELQQRLVENPSLDIPGALPDSVKASVTVLPNGKVGQLFFDTPLENPALAGALRKLKFRPADGYTSGQLEIRFVSEGSL
jgi:hypothetical protein